MKHSLRYIFDVYKKLIRDAIIIILILAVYSYCLIYHYAKIKSNISEDFIAIPEDEYVSGLNDGIYTLLEYRHIEEEGDHFRLDTYLGNGIHTHSYILNFDDNGNIIYCKDILSYNEKTSSMFYEYDKNGRIISETIFKGSKIDELYNYQYTGGITACVHKDYSFGGVFKESYGYLFNGYNDQFHFEDLEDSSYIKNLLPGSNGNVIYLLNEFGDYNLYSIIGEQGEELQKLTLTSYKISDFSTGRSFDYKYYTWYDYIEQNGQLFYLGVFNLVLEDDFSDEYGYAIEYTHFNENGDEYIYRVKPFDTEYNHQSYTGKIKMHMTDEGRVYSIKGNDIMGHSIGVSFDGRFLYKYWIEDKEYDKIHH